MSAIPEDDNLAELDALFGYTPKKKTSGATDDIDVTDLLERMRGGVFKQESGGNYQVKPNRRTGATGGFQVLPENIPAWTQKHLGRRLTREQFESDPQAQESVFSGEMGNYLKKARAKAPDDDTALRMAAAAWYGGEGRMGRYDDPVRFRPNEPSFREYTMGVLNKSGKPRQSDNTGLAELDKMFGYTAPSKGGPSALAGDLAELDSLFGYNADIKGGQPSPTNPTQMPFKPLATPPVPELDITLEAQRKAAHDPNSTRAAVLYTPGANIAPVNNDLETDLPLKDGGVLRATRQKLQQLLQTDPDALAGIMNGTRDFTDLIGGKATPTQDTSADKPTIITRDAQGNELIASSLDDVNDDIVATEAALQKAQFPNQPTQTFATTGEEVIKGRIPLEENPITPLANMVQRQQVMDARRGNETPVDVLLRPQREAQNRTQAEYQAFLQQTGLPDSQESLDEFNLAMRTSVEGTNAQNRQDVDAYNAQLRGSRSVAASPATSPTNQESLQVPTNEQSSAVPVRQTTDADAALAVRQEVDVKGVKGDKKEYALRKVLSEYGVPQDKINDGIQRLRAEGELLKGNPDGDTFAVNLTQGDINWIITGDERTPPDVMPQGEVAKRQRDAEGRISEEQLVARGYTMAPETEQEAEKLLEQRFREHDYSIQQRAAEFLSDPKNLITPNAILNAPSIFNDISDEWIAEEKNRLRQQHGTLAKALGAERYYQQGSAPETAARVIGQVARSFVKNLVSGTGKSLVFISQLNEDANPINKLLPDEAKVGLRNVGNYADFVTRLISSRDLETAKREMQWVKGTDDIEKQQIFASLKEFDKAIGDDPVLKGRFLGGLADAGGSALSFIALGAVMPAMPARILGKSRDLSIALSGALQTTGSGYEEGKRSGLSEKDAKTYGVIQGLLGTTEMLGAGAEAFSFIKNPMLRGRVANALLEVGKSAGREAKEEFAQEVFQTASGNAVLEYLKDNEPETLTKLSNALNRLPKQIAKAATNEGVYALITGGGMGGAGAAARVLSADETVEPGTAVTIDEGIAVVVEDKGKNVVVDYTDAKTGQKGRKVVRKTTVTLEPDVAEKPENIDTKAADVDDVDITNEAKTEVSPLKPLLEKDALVPDSVSEVPVSADVINKKTNLDLILDRVNERNEVNVRLEDGIKPDQLQRVEEEAVKRGMSAAFDGKNILIRKISETSAQTTKTADATDSPTAIAAEETQVIATESGRKTASKNNEVAPTKPTPLSNTQIEFSKEQARPVEDFRRNIIDPSDIADRSVLPEYAKDGIHEIEPHVTLKYGLHASKADEVAPMLDGEKPITVELGKTSVFKGSEKKIPGTDKSVPYDVVIVEVKSDDLKRLNKKLTEGSKNTTTFEYSPHVTLAYVKPGLGEKYAGKTDFEGQKYTFDGVTFSPADKSGKSVIPLSPTKKSPVDRTKNVERRTKIKEAAAGLFGGKRSKKEAPESAKSDIVVAEDARPKRTVKSESRPVLRQPRETKGRPHQGAETTVRIPDRKEGYKARYVLRELEDVVPSHNPFNFQPNEDYFFKNDRHYDKEPQYQEQVRSRSKSDVFDPAQLVNNNPTAETGPPIIDRDGNVLGGNSRSMMLARVFKDAGDNTSNAAKTKYLAAIRKDAAFYGIDPTAMDGMKQPVLVREVNDQSIESQAAITELNKTSTTALTSAERSVAEANRLSDGSVDFIAGRMESVGNDASLTEALNLHGADVVNRLIDEGVFAGGERNTLLDGNKITPDGKKRIERLLTGRIFDDLEQYEYAPDYLRRNMQRAIAPLVKTQSDEDWNVIPEVREAIDLLTEYKAKGGDAPLETFIAQPSFVRPQPWSAAAVGIAKKLRENPNAVSQAFKTYAGEFANAKSGGGLFGVSTQTEAFKTAFGVDIQAKALSKKAGDAEAVKTTPEVFAVPVIDDAMRLKRNVKVTYETASGKEVKKVMTVAKRQAEIVKKESVIRKLVDCING